MSEQVSAVGGASGPMARESQDDGPGIDAGTKRLLFIMGGIGVVLLAGIGAYGLSGRSGGEVPVILADTRPIRVKPDNPGGMREIAEPKRIDPSESRIAEGTEEPLPRTAPRTGNFPSGPAVPAKPAARTIAVQLTTARSESEAQAAWDRMAKRQPKLFSGRQPSFLQTSQSGKTPWQLRAAGFADTAQAKAFCDQVKAKGGKCSIVEP